MGTTKMNLKSLTLTFLACLLVALPAFARVTSSGSTLNFTVPNASLGYALTVIGPNDYHETETFAAGSAITWTVKGDDGPYKFELTSMADHRVRGVDSPVKAKPVKISGSALLQGGLFVNADRPENIQKDIVHLDDTIIQFSLCIGNDCVNGENFGFDTLRLKENNVRIHFDDTSTSASFPKNDWRIIINDSSNGGANYFGVEDSTAGRIPFRVEAGAPVNTLYAEADGDVGIKTANPVVDLHIVEGNTPTLRLEQDGSDGFTPQTYDIAGNESNFFIRDVTNGSKLTFRMKPNAPEDSIFVAADGSIGLGTDNPGSGLHVLLGGSPFNADAAATVDTTLELQNSANAADVNIMTMIAGETGQSQINFGAPTDAFQGRIIYENGNDRLRLFTNGVAALTIDSAGNVDIDGLLTTNGTCNGGGCDLVFEPDFDLPTIEEHAAEMWQNRHLPAVGPTAESGPRNLSQMTGGMLNELEKAHIYIEQLHNTIQEMNERLEKLETVE